MVTSLCSPSLSVHPGLKLDRVHTQFLGLVSPELIVFLFSIPILPQTFVIYDGFLLQPINHTSLLFISQKQWHPLPASLLGCLLARHGRWNFTRRRNRNRSSSTCRRSRWVDHLHHCHKTHTVYDWMSLRSVYCSHAHHLIVEVEL